MRETKVVPDFIVVERFKPRLIVQTKIAHPSTDISEPVESLAFRIVEFKRKINGFKVML